jgi:hypothetical protein
LPSSKKRCALCHGCQIGACTRVAHERKSFESRRHNCCWVR